MATTLNSIVDLAGDATFRDKVRAALAICARDVGSEAGPLHEEYHVLRREAARASVVDPEYYVDAAAWLVATNPAIKRSSDDDDIQFTVNSIFPVLAACGPAPSSTP